MTSVKDRDGDICIGLTQTIASANVVSGFGFGMSARAPSGVVAPIVVKLLGAKCEVVHTDRPNGPPITNGDAR